MNVEIWTEAAQFLFLELINRNFFALQSASFRPIISPSEAFFLTRSTLSAKLILRKILPPRSFLFASHIFCEALILKTIFSRFLSTAEPTFG